jgi:hypothetical protein
MKKGFMAFALLTSFIFFACQQELPAIMERIDKCRIDYGHYYGGGGMHDSAHFIYDGAGRVIKLDMPNGFYTYEYTGNNITLRKYFEGGTDLMFIDTLRYDASSSLVEMVSADYSLWWGDTTRVKTLFGYTAGKLTRLTHIEAYSSTGPFTDTLVTLFNWNAAGNIEKMVFLDALGEPIDSALYQYNTHENYFRAVHPHFWLFDPNFQLQVGLEAHFPYFYSRNNVIGFDIYGSSLYEVQYGLDSTKNLTTVNMDGDPYMEYRYKCTQ